MKYRIKLTVFREEDRYFGPFNSYEAASQLLESNGWNCLDSIAHMWIWGELPPIVQFTAKFSARGILGIEIPYAIIQEIPECLLFSPNVFVRWCKQWTSLTPAQPVTSCT